MTMTCIAKFGLCGVLLLAGVAQADVIKAQNAQTVLKWDGMQLTMLRTQVDMNNAHPVEYVQFFAPALKSGPASLLTFEVRDDYLPHLKLQRGADCAVSAVRVNQQGERLQLVYAHRKGEWAESKPVEFQVFELFRSEGGLPGTPDLYFREVRKVNSSKPYCDANMALDKEVKTYQ